MRLTPEQVGEYRKELAGMGKLPLKMSVGMPEDGLYRPVAIAHACWEIRDLLDTIAALEAKLTMTQSELNLADGLLQDMQAKLDAMRRLELVFQFNSVEGCDWTAWDAFAFCADKIRALLGPEAGVDDEVKSDG